MRCGTYTRHVEGWMFDATDCASPTLDIDHLFGLAVTAESWLAAGHIERGLLAATFLAYASH